MGAYIAGQVFASIAFVALGIMLLARARKRQLSKKNDVSSRVVMVLLYIFGVFLVISPILSLIGASQK